MVYASERLQLPPRPGQSTAAAAAHIHGLAILCSPATPASHINYLAIAVGRDEKLTGEGEILSADLGLFGRVEYGRSLFVLRKNRPGTPEVSGSSLRSAESILGEGAREVCYHFCYPTPEHGVRTGRYRIVNGQHQSPTKSAGSISRKIAWDGRQRTAKPCTPVQFWSWYTPFRSMT
jgi:hypothetical protein